ncbi:MAG TPA: sigma-70 family RNA polymerase sigma factor [Vicinamibacteria bacterium]|nr:sigma-70 family RNA polymerase sigma factor [Vicinamibacteria bacterium]
MPNAFVAHVGEDLSGESDVARLKRGRPEAIEALLGRYQNRLFRYLLRLVGDSAQAEDLLQQTWMRVMTHVHQYDERRAFEPWLFAVSRNLAIDHLRRTAPDSLSNEQASEVAGNDPSPLDQLLDRELHSRLAAKLQRLPVAYREALSLRFEEEMTFDEMAELLQCPLSTVKSRVQRGLAALRKGAHSL